MKNVTQKGDDLVLTDGLMKAYIMKSWVGKAPARIIGRKVQALGFMPLKFFSDNEGKNEIAIKTLIVPSMVDFTPVDIQEEKVKIYPESDPKEYVVMTFEKNDRICQYIGAQKLDNVVLFTDLMINAQLDNNIPYKLLTPAWVTNMISNDVSLHVPITNIDYIVSNLCRYKHDRKKRFADVLGRDPKTSQVEYVFQDVRTICANTSVYAALSFEDMNFMLDSALNATLSNREQIESPLEPIIKL